MRMMRLNFKLHLNSNEEDILDQLKNPDNYMEFTKNGAPHKSIKMNAICGSTKVKEASRS